MAMTPARPPKGWKTKKIWETEKVVVFNIPWYLSWINLDFTAGFVIASILHHFY